MGDYFGSPPSLVLLFMIPPIQVRLKDHCTLYATVVVPTHAVS